MISTISRTVADLWLQKRRTSPEETLRWLLKKAETTRFGLKYSFTALLREPNIYAAFSQNVPIIDYTGWLKFLGSKYTFHEGKPSILNNESWPGSIRYFCLSSGTSTGKTKYIPYSHEMAVLNRRAAIECLCHLIKLELRFSPLSHKTLYMSGSTALEPDDSGVVCGDMSGLTSYLAPKALSWLTYPPSSISSLEPWSLRLPALVDFAMSKGRNIGILSGIPVWQKTFLEAVKEQAGVPLKDVFPNMHLMIHGGMPLGPYASSLKTLLGPDVRLIDVYAASETGITAVGLGRKQGLELWPHYGVFYEFEDEQSRVVPMWDVQEGTRYQLIISSCSGLWRYRIGDEVRVLQKSPLRIDSVFRAQTSSAFDEKITEEQIVTALNRVLPGVSDFSMGPDPAEKRHHWFLLTINPLPPRTAEQLDEQLRLLNQDYDDYRSDGRIRKPVCTGISNRRIFLETIGREEGGQRKFPRLLSTEEVILLK